MAKNEKPNPIILIFTLMVIGFLGGFGGYKWVRYLLTKNKDDISNNCDNSYNSNNYNSCPTSSPKTSCPICKTHTPCPVINPCPTRTPCPISAPISCPTCSPCSPPTPCPTRAPCTPVTPCPTRAPCTIYDPCPVCPIDTLYQFYFPYKSSSSDRRCVDKGSAWSGGYGDWACDKNNGNQNFYLKYFEDMSFRVQNQNGGCLTVSDNYWYFEDCNTNPNYTYQKFKWKDFGADKRMIESVQRGGKCLNIGNNKKNYDCGDGSDVNARLLLIG
jgi:hypothetical protein